MPALRAAFTISVAAPAVEVFDSRHLYSTTGNELLSTEKQCSVSKHNVWQWVQRSYVFLIFNQVKTTQVYYTTDIYLCPPLSLCQHSAHTANDAFEQQHYCL